MDVEKKQIPIEEGLFTIPASEDEKPVLLGAKCHVCGLAAFPIIATCPRCAIPGTMMNTPLKGRGKLDAFSIVHAALPGFKAPSIQAYIILEEGARIWSLVTGCEPREEALRIGMDMELVVAKVREDADGNDIISYQFKPAVSQSPTKGASL
jgi:uncharacterized OB-fold protein